MQYAPTIKRYLAKSYSRAGDTPSRAASPPAALCTLNIARSCVVDVG